MTLNINDIGAGVTNSGRKGFAGRLAALRESSFGKTFEQVFLLSATHGISGFLVLGTFVLLANKLGPELYGEFTFVDSVLFIAILLASLGTEYVGNREVARTTEARELVSGILILRALASVAVFVLILAWALFFYRFSEPSRSYDHRGRSAAFSTRHSRVVFSG